MKLGLMVYSNLKEEQDYSGWDKETITYAIENESYIKNSIKNTINRKYKSLVGLDDVGDIYSNSLIYLYNVKDYDINHAVVDKANGEQYVVTLDDYVFSAVINSIKRYMTEKYKIKQLEVPNEIKRADENEVNSILDLIAVEDKEMDYVGNLVDLKQHCKQNESQRYKYGIDIYQLWFVGLLTIKNNLKDGYEDIMNILGYDKKTLKEIYKQLEESDDELVIDFALAINIAGIDESIEIIKEFVYSAKNIERAVENIAA